MYKVCTSYISLKGYFRANGLDLWEASMDTRVQYVGVLLSNLFMLYYKMKLSYGHFHALDESLNNGVVTGPWVELS